MIEIWSPIAERGEDQFAVSDHGRVMNMLTMEIMEQYVHPDDIYVKVHLNNGFHDVHELVAHAHLCCLDCDIWEVYHLDGDQMNNAVWNLDMRVDHDEYEKWRENYNYYNCE